MSTKFRQSFLRLCHGCCTSSKNQQSSAVLFCKEYAMRPMLISVNRDGIAGRISTTDRSNIQQLQEKRLLLVDSTPTPLTTTTIDAAKFIFPQ